MLQAQPDIRIVITGHPEKSGDKASEDLAKKRAEAVRFYLEDQGIAIVRNDIVTGAEAVKGGPIVEVSLFSAGPPKAPVKTAPAPAAAPAKK